MRVVSDTSPLYNLAAIGQLHLLRLQFDAVLIPPAVARELDPIRDTPAGAAIAAAIRAGDIQELAAQAQTLVHELSHEVDDGEAAALALASALGLTVILIDEKRGRRVAKKMGLRPIGILGVLLQAKHAGDVPSVAHCLAALRKEAGFYFSDELGASVLRAAGET